MQVYIFWDWTDSDQILHANPQVSDAFPADVQSQGTHVLYTPANLVFYGTSAVNDQVPLRTTAYTIPVRIIAIWMYAFHIGLPA